MMMIIHVTRTIICTANSTLMPTATLCSRPKLQERYGGMLFQTEKEESLTKAALREAMQNTSWWLGQKHFNAILF